VLATSIVRAKMMEAASTSETLVNFYQTTHSTTTQSSIALMMEALSTYETSVNFYHTAWYNIPEDSHTRHRDNPKSRVVMNLWVP
jgi:hypothetical protein